MSNTGFPDAPSSKSQELQPVETTRACNEYLTGLYSFFSSGAAAAAVTPSFVSTRSSRRARATRVLLFSTIVPVGQFSIQSPQVMQAPRSKLMFPLPLPPRTVIALVGQTSAQALQPLPSQG